MKKIYKEPNKSETETTINVMHGENKLSIYTNKVSLQRELNKILGEPTKEYKIKKSIVGSSWEDLEGGPVRYQAYRYRRKKYPNPN